MKRIGIYSGTFDPIHNGHVSFALQAMDVVGLDEVVFLPEATPREKDDVTDISHRFEMIKQAIQPLDNLSVRMLEVERFCAYGALPELQEIFGDDELWMLLGSDVVRTFSYRWKDLDKVFAQLQLVVAIRHGDSAKDITNFLKRLDTKVKPKFVVVDSPLSAINSTRIRNGMVVRDVVPDTLEYIRQHHLYSR
jgi:nicotinate-nucleotide adenylyltransferase